MSQKPTMPPFLTLKLNGSPLTLDGKPSAKGNVWYNLNGKVPGVSEDPEAALAAITAEFDGEALKAGDVHISEPSLFPKGHVKAGQVRSKGGNPTVTHSGAINVADASGEKHVYLARVTVTYVAKEDSAKTGFKVNAKAFPQAQNQGKILEGIVIGATV